MSIEDISSNYIAPSKNVWHLVDSVGDYSVLLWLLCSWIFVLLAPFLLVLDLVFFVYHLIQKQKEEKMEPYCDYIPVEKDPKIEITYTPEEE